jgi:hypothetical protein
MGFYGPHLQFFIPLWFSSDWWQEQDECPQEHFLAVIEHALYLGKHSFSEKKVA